MLKRVCVAALLVAAGWAHAEVVVSDAWVRGTVPQQKATGAFMQIKSSTAVALVGAQSAAAGVVEVHEMKMEGDTMKMHAIPRLEIPANQPVALKPGGYHIMLMDLKAPLAVGAEVPVTLQFENADKTVQTVDIKAPVRALTAPANPSPNPHVHAQ